MDSSPRGRSGCHEVLHCRNIVPLLFPLATTSIFAIIISPIQETPARVVGAPFPRPDWVVVAAEDCSDLVVVVDYYIGNILSPVQTLSKETRQKAISPNRKPHQRIWAYRRGIDAASALPEDHRCSRSSPSFTHDELANDLRIDSW